MNHDKKGLKMTLFTSRTHALLVIMKQTDFDASYLHIAYVQSIMCHLYLSMCLVRHQDHHELTQNT